MNLIYLARAEADLLDIYCAIGVHDELAAKRLIDTIEISVQRLRDYPLSAPARLEIAPDARGMAIGSYLILYRAIDDRVEVVRVVHGARWMGTFTSDFEKLP